MPTRESRDEQQALGRAVRERRSVLKVSQEALAVRCGLHRTYVADIERGTRNPSWVSLLCVAKGLGVAPSELVKAAEGYLQTPSTRAKGRAK